MRGCALAIGWAWEGCLAPEAGPTCNRVHGGPLALLGWLETQLGLPRDESAGWTARVTRYAARLAALERAACAASLAADRWATAADLLARRDELLLAGWDGRRVEGLPALLGDLARAERGAPPLPPGVAERLAAVRDALDAGQRLPEHDLRLAEEPSLWPPAWEICFSNSLIEAWWRVLKHQWLYLNHFDSIAKVRSLVAFYVAEHNTRIPHSAFRGQTPDEMYFGTGAAVPDQLAAAREAARARRLATNRAARCALCAPA